MESDRKAPKRGVDTHKGITMLDLTTWPFEMAMEHWQYTLLAWFLLSFPCGMLVGMFMRAGQPDEPIVIYPQAPSPNPAETAVRNMADWARVNDLIGYEERCTLVAYLADCGQPLFSSPKPYVVNSQGVCVRGS